MRASLPLALHAVRSIQTIGGLSRVRASLPLNIEIKHIIDTKVGFHACARVSRPLDGRQTDSGKVGFHACVFLASTTTAWLILNSIAKSYTVSTSV